MSSQAGFMSLSCLPFKIRTFPLLLRRFVFSGGLKEMIGFFFHYSSGRVAVLGIANLSVQLYVSSTLVFLSVLFTNQKALHTSGEELQSLLGTMQREKYPQVSTEAQLKLPINYLLTTKWITKGNSLPDHMFQGYILKPSRLEVQKLYSLIQNSI